MKRKLVVFITIFSLIILTACGSNKATESTVAEAEMQDETSGDVSETNVYPLTLVDQAGREVVIEKEPQSLVSSYYITTSAMLALGLKDEIKGIESNPEKRPLYSLCAKELLEVTQVGSPKEFDLEACASINPDLVVLPMRAKDVAEPLEQLGIPVIIVNPESQEEIFEMLELIAKATNHSELAEALISYIKEKTDYLSEVLSDCEKPSVYLGGNSSFLSTASKGMYQNNLISLAGGVNVAGDIDDTYWVESSYEQILSWNPEVIAMASDAKYSMEEILADANLKDCQAISEQKVYKIPSDVEAWDSPVPGSFLGAAYLASVLHPDLVSEEQYENMVEEFYETFYGFSYTKK